MRLFRKKGIHEKPLSVINFETKDLAITKKKNSRTLYSVLTKFKGRNIRDAFPHRLLHDNLRRFL